jgi:peptidoglycan/xylan/chitin deacetylase (PgdA/CDA1 family)
MPTSKKEIYLTFDDGPTEGVTDWVMDVLEPYKAKATFFCIGENIKNHPIIFKRIIKKGHSIGNHTYNHLKGWSVSKDKYIDNVAQAEEELSKYTLNNQTKLFRPPYGKIKPSQLIFLKKEGYQVIMWDVLSLDFDLSVSPEICLENVLKNTKNGSVIVFHDSLKASGNMKYVLPKVLEYFSSKGFSFRGI